MDLSRYVSLFIFVNGFVNYNFLNKAVEGDGVKLGDVCVLTDGIEPQLGTFRFVDFAF